MKGGRIAVAALTLSASAFVAILTREDYREAAYIPTKGDVPTIGFGTTEGVQLGDKTTPVKAVARALADTARYEGAIKRCVKVPLHQAEYDLYTDLSYNIGPAAFCGSSLVKALNQQRYAAACEHILDWRMFKGQDCSKPNKICAGLWTDRQRIHKQCVEAQ